MLSRTRPRTRSGAHVLTLSRSHALSLSCLCISRAAFLCFLLFLFLWFYSLAFFSGLFFFFSFSFLFFLFFLFSFFFFLFLFPFSLYFFVVFCFWVCFIYKFWARRLRFPSSCRVSQRLRRPDARFPPLFPSWCLVPASPLSTLTSSLAVPTTIIRANPSPSGWCYTPPSFCLLPNSMKRKSKEEKRKERPQPHTDSCLPVLSLTLTHSTLSTLSLFLLASHSGSLLLTRSHTLSHALTPSHTLSRSLALPRSHALTLSHALTPSLSTLSLQASDAERCVPAAYAGWLATPRTLLGGCFCVCFWRGIFGEGGEGGMCGWCARIARIARVARVARVAGIVRMRGCEDCEGCEGCEDCPCQWTEVDGRLAGWCCGAAVGWGVLLRRGGWLGFWRWLPGSSQRCAFLVEAEPAGPASMRK